MMTLPIGTKLAAQVYPSLALAPLAVSFLLMAVVVLVDRGAFGGFEKKKEPLPEEKEVQHDD